MGGQLPQAMWDKACIYCKKAVPLRAVSQIRQSGAGGYVKKVVKSLKKREYILIICMSYKRILLFVLILATGMVSVKAQGRPIVVDTESAANAQNISQASDSLNQNTVDSEDVVIGLGNYAVTDSMFGVSPEPQKMSLIERVENWYSDNMNYGSIVALMTVESSFIPFPSEVVIPPAAYVADNEGSSLHVTDSYPVNVLLVVLFGTIGAILGAIINYVLSMWLGRPIIYAFADSRVGRMLLLSSEKIRKAEDYFNDHGKMSTFVGRLIPGIRQLISIPAGLAKMHFGRFLLYTFLGAFLWNTILALLGYIAHGQMDLIHAYSHELSIAILAILGIVIVYFVVRAIVRKCRSKQ